MKPNWSIDVFPDDHRNIDQGYAEEKVASIPQTPKKPSKSVISSAKCWRPNSLDTTFDQERKSFYWHSKSYHSICRMWSLVISYIYVLRISAITSNCQLHFTNAMITYFNVLLSLPPKVIWINLQNINRNQTKVPSLNLQTRSRGKEKTHTRI